MRAARGKRDCIVPVKPNFPLSAMSAQHATSSATIVTSPPCITLGAPWCASSGVKRVTTSSPSTWNFRRSPVG